jgi:protein-S-isoprenylcysteine O-methyltransferase Ste14
MGLASGLVWMALIGLILFGCAGRWDVPAFWAYLGVFVAFTGVWVIMQFMGRIDPGLVKERLRPGPGAQGFTTGLAILLLWLGQYVVAGLDVGRYHWTDNVPLAVQVVGLVALTASLVVLMWASAVNRFFSSAIRIQRDRGHHVITTGPYRFVRHPAYACGPFLMAGGGLGLGSWLAGLIGLATALVLYRHAAVEDRVLREQLEGYADYARKVRYRVLPGIW